MAARLLGHNAVVGVDFPQAMNDQRLRSAVGLSDKVELALQFIRNAAFVVVRN